MDIEDPKNMQWHAQYFKCRYTPEAFQIKQEYYRLATQFYYEFEFENKTQKRIWKLHSEGITTEKIAKYVRIPRSTVHWEISRLLEVMKDHHFDRDS